jgi:hypothetical protein
MICLSGAGGEAEVVLIERFYRGEARDAREHLARPRSPRLALGEEQLLNEVGERGSFLVTVAVNSRTLENFRVGHCPNYWPIEQSCGRQGSTPCGTRWIDCDQIPKNSVSVATVRLRLGIA